MPSAIPLSAPPQLKVLKKMFFEPYAGTMYEKYLQKMNKILKTLMYDRVSLAIVLMGEEDSRVREWRTFPYSDFEDMSLRGDTRKTSREVRNNIFSARLETTN